MDTSHCQHRCSNHCCSFPHLENQKEIRRSWKTSKAFSSSKMIFANGSVCTDRLQPLWFANTWSMGNRIDPCNSSEKTGECLCPKCWIINCANCSNCNNWYSFPMGSNKNGQGLYPWEKRFQIRILDFFRGSWIISNSDCFVWNILPFQSMLWTIWLWLWSSIYIVCLLDCFCTIDLVVTNFLPIWIQQNTNRISRWPFKRGVNCKGTPSYGRVC